jgi:hydroxymethylbilane synthase
VNDVHIRIATRQSELALWQANHVADRLRLQPGVDAVTLVPLTTRGDRILDRSLQKIGGKGLFIKELEVAMRTGDADIAVHSMKDVPAALPEDFCIAAVLERADPLDALVTPAGALDELPGGAVVGSSSLRRQAQLLAMRPDLEVRPLRGNVNTRLRKLDDGAFDAIVLACAGLERLGLEGRISERLSPERMLPAAGQGVIGIECAVGRDDLKQTLAALEHRDTRQTVLAERVVARLLEASCRSPVASYAILQDGAIRLAALVASPDGRTLLRRQATANAADAEALGTEVARQLLDAGAADVLADAEGP